MTGYIGSNAATYIDVTPRLPTGVIVMWSGAISAIPSGWHLCDGNNGTPNLTGKFVVHADADSGGTYAPNATGGSDSVALSESELPSHTHSVSGLSTSSAGEHTHTMNHQINKTGGGGGTVSNAVTTAEGVTVNINNNSAGAHTHTISGTLGSTGSGTAHENRPPYYALAYIMKG